MTLVKKYSLFFLIPLILILINSCNRKSNYIIKGSTMGTTYNINIFAPFVDVDSLKNKIDFLLADINKKMSTYDKSSEISKFNNYEKGKYRVSNDFLNVVDKAIAYSNISKNYDITIKPILDLWGFDKFQDHLMPDSSDIENALKHIGIKNIFIEDNQLVKLNNFVKIDLSSIAKGYAVDQISDLLNDLSLTNHMVEIGGEIKVSGYNGGEKWSLGVLNPLNGNIFKVIKLHNKSIATSGTYNNFLIINDTEYSHLINPRTGYPIKHNAKSVTVISNNCIDADALATLIITYENPYDAIKVINMIDNVEALILVLDDDNQIIEVKTKNYDKYYVN